MPSFIVLTDYTHVGNSFIRPFVQATKGPKMPLFSSRRLQSTAILYRCVH